MIREVARIEPATVRFRAPSAEREPNAQASSISATLLERGKQFLPVSGARKAPTLVLDLNEHAIGAAT